MGQLGHGRLMTQLTHKRGRWVMGHGLWVIWVILPCKCIEADPQKRTFRAAGGAGAVEAVH